MWATRWLAMMLLSGAFALPCSAQNAEQARAEAKAAFEAARAAMQPGPADISLGNQASLKLPNGFVFVPIEESKRLLQAMGNQPGAGLLGTVFPRGDASWLLVIHFVDAGYVKDDDAKDWKADELLASLKQGTEAGNEARRQRGIGEIEVVGWVEQPKYDATTHRLVWSAAVQQKGASAGAEQAVNYNTYALGREGYISLNLVTDLRTVERDKSVAHELLGALGYNDGKRYTDFTAATDRVAEYGLAALIGGIAAKKLGLFALAAAFLLKFWKLGLIALAGAGALLPRLLKGKKRSDMPPPGA